MPKSPGVDPDELAEILKQQGAEVKDGASEPPKRKQSKTRKPSEFDLDIVDSYRKYHKTGELSWKFVDVQQGVDVPGASGPISLERAVELELRRAVRSVPQDVDDKKLRLSLRMHPSPDDPAHKTRISFATLPKEEASDE